MLQMPYIFRLRLFQHKTIFVKYFPNFPVFGNIIKHGQRKTIFSNLQNGLNSIHSCIDQKQYNKNLYVKLRMITPPLHYNIMYHTNSIQYFQIRNKLFRCPLHYIFAFSIFIDSYYKIRKIPMEDCPASFSLLSFTMTLQRKK